MIHERIPLRQDDPDVWLETFVPDPLQGFVRKAILVIPGGAYCFVCSDREGEPIAQAFLPYGYAAFVLHYSVAGSRVFPAQLIEASAAMKHIRDNSERYGIDPTRVFVTGFSAGGHLAGSLGVLWHRKEIYEAVPMPFGYNRPDGMILVYPVISADPAISHADSFRYLFGGEPTPEQSEEASLEKRVDERSAPVFLVHSSDDTAVPVENSLRMAEAYRKAGRTFSLMICPEGPHGFALGNDITALGIPAMSSPLLASWLPAAVRWADSLPVSNCDSES